MKRILAAAFALSVLAVQPVQAGFEKKKTETEAVTTATTAVAAVPAAVAAPAAPVAPAAVAPIPSPQTPTKDDLAQRSQKGVDNQKAWVATLEKQLAGEKTKLAAMEAEHSKAFGSSSKKS